MKKEFFSKKTFWCAFLISLLLNLLILYIFREKARKSDPSLFALIVLIFVSFKGVVAYVCKDAGAFIYIRARDIGKRFWRYNKPTAEDIKDFWMAATVYFFVIPFYLPVIFFSTASVHLQWCLLLLLIPPLVYAGYGMRTLLHMAKHAVKEEKLKQKKQEQERIEQERREELGNWK